MGAGPTLVLREEGAETLTLAGSRLLVLRGPDRGRALHIEREEVVVGTSPSADLVLTDRTVSRHHLSVRILSDGCLVTDLESTNGTMVGGRRVRAAYVDPGDRIDLGATQLRVEARRDVVALPLSPGHSFGRLIGRSASARRVFAMLAAAGPTDVTVLLVGETGTGKDLAAEALHAASPRASGPFVVVDCGAIPPALLESELFGHERGAFTGATARRVGAFEEAQGGTLFLDEVGELPRELQTRLLGVLQRRQLRRLGGSEVIAVDARIVAATNRDLRLEVNRGRFREDLLHRLNTLTIRMPPLRERLEDVPLLAEHFRRELTGDPEGELPPELVESLAGQAWSGNVRELRNHVERVLVLDPLPPPPPSSTGERERQPFRQAKAEAIEAFERAYLTALLAEARGNRSEAARLASMDRVHLSKLLRRHQLGGGGR